MVKTPGDWTITEYREYQQAYQIKSPNRDWLKVCIGFQSTFGLWLACMGIACIQTFHANLSDGKNSLDDWHLKEMPDWPWIFNLLIGVLIMIYGFFGFWLAERRRLVWRISAHLLLQVVFMALAACGLAFTICLERHCLGTGVVIATIVSFSAMLVFQLVGVAMLIAELIVIHATQVDHIKYHQAMARQGEPISSESGEARSFAQKIGLVG